MPLTTRPAVVADAVAMVELLNSIIRAGGTTAHETLYLPAKMIQDYIAAERGISCIVALKKDQLVGFQSLAWPYPNDDTLPAHWAIIATFVKSGMVGAGIGTTLFHATTAVAKSTGVIAIDATIRADNSGGLAYYTKMGFVDYRLSENVPLRDGTPVDRISKRFDLI